MPNAFRFHVDKALTTLFVLIASIANSSDAVAQSITVANDKMKSTIAEPADRDWWPERHEQKLKEKESRADEIELVMIGDSIMHAWEETGKALWETHFEPLGALNLGYSGDRTENVLWRLAHGEVEGLSPKAVVLLIGTNNAGHREEAPVETAAGIRTILDELRQRLPETKILLLAIFPRDKKPSGKYRQLTDATNEHIKDFADDEHVFYLDINDKFLGDDGTLPESIMPDELHPNEAGYKIWVEAMMPALQRLMES